MSIRFLLLVVVLFGTTTLYAKYFSFSHVHQMPKSIEKDYYIWRFLLQKSTTPLEATAIISEVTKLNKKLRTAYKNKTGLAPNIYYNTKGTSTLHRKRPSTWKIRHHAKKNFNKGLALMKERRAEEAAKYFETARLYYTKREDIDKALFWLYLSTNSMKYLKALRQSHDVNIYTLMAADSMKARYPKTITEYIKERSYLDHFDITDPIAWAKTKKQIRSSHNLDSLAEEYKSQESIGIYTYIKAKASKFKDIYFPMPYRDALKEMPKKRQALIYAIARQESRFVPASVSRSFALGMMQFMPFLIRHIAKQKGEKIDLDEIFNPYKAIEYANTHLDYLTTYLHHPLFIAYAYNGGIGFTKRYIQNHFRKGAYEPYMSMETMKNEETREYGKKVFANYIIYLNKLGVKTRIFPLLRILATPEKTDKFRKATP